MLKAATSWIASLARRIRDVLVAARRTAPGESGPPGSLAERELDIAELAGCTRMTSDAMDHAGHTAHCEVQAIEFEWGLIQGIDRDGLAGSSVTLIFGAGGYERIVDLEIEVSASMQAAPVEVVVTKSNERSIARYTLNDGEVSKIRLSLTDKPGSAQLLIRPAAITGALGATRTSMVMIRKIEVGDVVKRSLIFPTGIS